MTMGPRSRSARATPTSSSPGTMRGWSATRGSSDSSSSRARPRNTRRAREDCAMTTRRRDFIVGAGTGLVVGLPGVAGAAARPVGVAPEVRAANGGAQDGDPNSFASGRLVARYAGQFRNIQTVYAPDHAVTQIIGELVQRSAHPFVVRGTHRRLGRVGLLQRLEASGSATRTEPTIPRSIRYVAGGITTPH